MAKCFEIRTPVVNKCKAHVRRHGFRFERQSMMDGSKSNAPLAARQFLGWLLFLLVTSFCGVYLFVDREQSTVEEDVERKIPLGFCPDFCEARSQQMKQHHGGDLLDNTYLLDAVQRESKKVQERLQKDYGEQAFSSMWMNINATTNESKIIGEHIFTSANPNSTISYFKFRRKLQMKILQMQNSILDDMKNLEGCDCTSPKHASRRRLQQQQQLVLPKVKPHYARFVWATGGHSGAAGHGNLYNESYTAHLERVIKDVFQSVGIEFVGRNYAMGGMDSSPQLALCNEAVYGQDADAILWDFGMTDGPSYWKHGFFSSRTGVHMNRPTHFSMMSMTMSFGRFRNRMNTLQQTEDAGVATLALNPEVEAKVVNGIPDVFGMPTDEVEKIGPFARYFKCNNEREKNDPCFEQKYNDDVCPDRLFKASWHPGWRNHALTGNLLSLFLVESLLDAVRSMPYKNPRAMYAELKAKEDIEYEAFLKATVPAEIPGFISKELSEAGVVSHDFFRSRAVCKTALLPAQTRYLGILTESDLKGEFYGYDMGTEFEYAAEHPPAEARDFGHLILAYEQKMRQQCPVDLNVDYKDFFYAKQEWGWVSLTFPNDAEIATYAPDGFKPLGLIVLCLRKCDWGKCPVGEVNHETFVTGELKMSLNGNNVTDLTQIDQCFLVKTSEGYYHKPNGNGRYELRVLLGAHEDVNSTSIRLTSIIVL